ncbi:Uu.00g084640.m01.CDS01 [Anthostomella pinea]|uniref:Uu.00g084640.m01.CDS01 n=1 Tax=Anthostomella pinea TaxID=933095 RepID=A0AAI8YJV1_9PEZI|nr:Uu.00g084640.m01.CDS01 [Anthostomella pinea]
MRQVSPEAEAIFDFIMELHRSCAGNWQSMAGYDGVTERDVRAFAEYAATFLSNVGNYYGSGDQKFVPRISYGSLRVLSNRTRKLQILWQTLKDSILATQPSRHGYPSHDAQSAYYLGKDITKDEIALVSRHMDAHTIMPENTRIRKTGDISFEVLQASDPAMVIDMPLPLEGSPLDSYVVGKYLESFRLGSLEKYRDSQRLWVTDKAPKVESVFGFVEPYRDPAGIRAEFEGLVGIADAEETKLLSNLVRHSDKFIRRLPWASAENNGKGAFEKSLFDPPDFASIHALAYCSSIVFPGINLPNYNDIRHNVGFKNVIIANRMAAESTAIQWPFIPDSEAEAFKKNMYPAYYWWVVLHELLGHRTGKFMVEEQPGKFNFDIKHPPTDPLTGRPIKSWYRPGQTWTGIFGDLATTVDECRAELVGAYLMDDTELLALLGFTSKTDIKASDLTYNLYQHLGVDGLRGLANVSADGKNWGQAHSRAHYAILRCLLRDGHGCIRIQHDEQRNSLKVHVDRSKILTHGKKALGNMLLRLHVYRCTADVQACREYYEDLTKVDNEALRWRKTVDAEKPPPMLNVQANTFLRNGEVAMKEYEPTVEGIIQSWYDREV